ncbi:MAG: hypothetical protein KDE09_06360 [Anaerolineales bacterium]|nr:hypothetical protein [Anaerolineales bacterium]
MATENHETFDDFKNSFSYGSRPDLNFKFLKSLSEEEAAAFFQGLLWKLGDFINDGDGAALVEHLRAGQQLGYAAPSSYAYDEGPFVRLDRPVAESRLALITSTGHFPADQDPEPFGVKGMTQAEAIERISDFTRSAPELTPIPVDLPAADLAVRHGGYDIRGAQADRNTSLPLDRLRELAAAGWLKLHETAYSFVGAAAQMRILNKTGPEWVEQFKQAGIEGALLIPV